MQRPARRTTLFGKLLLYFLLVMLVPVLLTSLYQSSIAARNMKQGLIRQAQESLSGVAEKMRESIESYSHLAFALSTDPLIVTTLSEDLGAADGSEGQARIYGRMYSIMKGRNADAAAHIVSSSGKTQFSTHMFPALYDIRYQRNAESPFDYWQETMKETASLVRTDRYINNNTNTVAINVMRRVLDQSHRVVGYAVIDIFQAALGDLCAQKGFSDIILVNARDLTSNSLLGNDRFGDFSRFPELKSIHPPYQGVHESPSVIVSVFPVYESQLFIAGVLRIDPYLATLRETNLVTLWIILGGIVISICLAAFLSRSVAGPINLLATSMRRLESGDFTVRVPEKRRDEIGELNGSFNTMVTQVESLIQRAKEEEKRLAAAELKALQSQINPHFLYNTLNTVKSIAKLHGEKEIHSIVVQLGKLLRGAIEGSDDVISLQKSIEQAESYLIIQQIRYGNKLQVHIDVPQAVLQVRTPKLLLQPIVENAVIHGLEPKTGDWRIRITGAEDGDRVSLTVADNGIGFDVSRIELRSRERRVGMANVYQRLKLYYGEEADLLVTSRIGEGSSVTLRFPSEHAGAT